MLRWEDCVKGDARKAEEEDWKKNTIDRGGWKRLSDETVTSCGQNLTPDKGKKKKKREREVIYTQFSVVSNVISILNVEITHAQFIVLAYYIY